MKDANAGPPPEPSEELDIEVETSPSFEESSAPSPATSRIVLEGDDRETCPRGIWPATVCDWVIEPDAYNEAQQNILVYVLADTRTEHRRCGLNAFSGTATAPDCLRCSDGWE